MLPKNVQRPSETVGDVVPLLLEQFNALDIDVATKIGIAQHRLDLATDAIKRTKDKLTLTFGRAKEEIVYNYANVIWVSTRGPFVRTRKTEEFVAGKTIEVPSVH